MPGTPMTATARHNGATLVRSVDGELGGMDMGPAPLGPVLEELTDRAELGKDAAWGHVAWSGVVSLAAGGTATVFALVLGAIGSITLYDGTGWSVKASGGETLTLAHVNGAPPNLAAATRYYAYAKLVAGALAFELSTDPPTANMLFKAGDVTRSYIPGATFVTDGAGRPLPFRCVRGHYRYALTGMPTGLTDVRALNGIAAATAWADVSLASLLPPYARAAHLRASVYNADSTKNGFAQFRTKGHTTGTVDVNVVEMGSAGNGAFNELHFELETDTNRVIQYQRGDGGGTYADIDVFLYVLGWDE